MTDTKRFLVRGFSRAALALAGAAVLLAGCATTQQTQAAYVQGCTAYAAAFEVALLADEAGKLNDAQIKQVSLIDSQITPICRGPMPADPTAAIAQITAAATTLTILEASKP